MSTIDDRRVNERIRARRILVISDDGEQLGEMSPWDAMDIAREKNLDLVEVAPNARPPVCKIMDYGKFKYTQNKRQSMAKKKQKNTQVKEVKFRVKTDDHDFDFKVGHIRRFLENGDKAKCTVQFRGREMTHPELGEKVLHRVIDELEGEAKVETRPTREGRSFHMILAPDPEAKKRREAEQAESATDE